MGRALKIRSLNGWWRGRIKHLKVIQGFVVFIICVVSLGIC